MPLPIWPHEQMVPPVRLERTSDSLGNCGFFHLSYGGMKLVAKVGLEPTKVSVFETGAVPISH